MSNVINGANDVMENEKEDNDRDNVLKPIRTVFVSVQAGNEK